MAKQRVPDLAYYSGRVSLIVVLLGVSKLYYNIYIYI